MGVLAQLAELLTGKPTISAAAQKECLEKGYKLAHTLLKDEGSVPPFGAGIARGGKVHWCLPEDGDPTTVREWLCKGSSEGPFLEVYLYCMVDYSAEGQPSNAGRALALYIDSPGPGASCRVAITPYAVENGALVAVGRPIVREAEERVFISGRPTTR